MGGTWRVPVACGLLSKNFVEDLKEDGTYSEHTFDREYESIWGGGNASSFFSNIEFDKCRVLQKPLFEAPYRPERGTKMIIGYDVGRTMDDSSMVILQLTPSIIGGYGTYIKKLVNIYSFEGMHFKDQAFLLKKAYYQFKADKIVIDGNGLGIGLLDFMTVKTENDTTKEVMPAFGVDKESDPKGTYKKFYQVPSGENSVLFIIKANDTLNNDMHNLVNAQIASQKVQFLIDDQLAQDQLKKTAAWKTYSEQKKIEMLRPYKLTKILREEMLNLRRTNDDGKTALKRIASGMKKDKFSAFEYALYYARLLELKNKNTGSIHSDTSLVTKKRTSLDRNAGSVRDRFGGRGVERRG